MSEKEATISLENIQKRIILDLCGGTGSWSKPYRDAGYDVRLVTLPENDVRIYNPPEQVYGVLAAPPCTQFSWARTNAKKARNLKEGMEIVNSCLRIIHECQYLEGMKYQKYSNLKFWALENPYYGFLKQLIGKPAFIFDPYEFGDGYKKRTAIWGYFNDPIKNPVGMTRKMTALCSSNSRSLPKFDQLKTKEIHSEFYGKLDRQARRAITPQGFAKAFFEANQ